MILETLINILFAPLFWFLSTLPTVDFDFLNSWESIRDLLKNIMAGVGCLLPIEEFIPLVTFQGGLYAFKLAYAIILRLKSLLPMWGGT